MAKTVDRRVLGSLNKFAPPGRWAREGRGKDQPLTNRSSQPQLAISLATTKQPVQVETCSVWNSDWTRIE